MYDNKIISNDIMIFIKAIQEPDFFERLRQAIGACKTLGIVSKADFYEYQPYVANFRDMTFEDLTFFERISNIEYNEYIKETCEKQNIDYDIINRKSKCPIIYFKDYAKQK